VSAFTFVHAADLHLGSPLAGLALRDPVLAERFADAIRAAVVGLVDAVIDKGARFLVISGDVYDGDWKDHSVGLFFNREMARLARAGIPVFVIRGNHDAQSVVTRSITLPDNVHVFGVRSPETHRLEDLGVAIHGQSFANRQVPENLARAYPAPLAGHFNIGLLHTSLTGRPPHADYAPCTVEDLKARGYDYWALGHVHAHEVVAQDPPIVFPGNIQGRSIRETGEKGAVLVRVVDGRVEAMERLVVDAARFARVELDVSVHGDRDALLAAVEEALASEAVRADGRPLAARLRLFGESPLRDALLAGRADLAVEVQGAFDRAGADLFLEKLVLDLARPGTQDPVQLGDGALDLASLLDEAAHDQDFRAAAQAEIAQIAARVPGGLLDPAAPFGEDLDALVDEARALLGLRIGGGA
jgi:DNA repair exonuclease SbcCD nuclease subunit